MVYTVSDFIYLLTLKLTNMINKIYLFPMFAHYNSAEDDRLAIAIGITLTVMSFIAYIIGYIYDGIKNDNWDLFDTMTNYSKALGGFFLCFMIICWITVALVMEIYKYL